MRQHTAAPSRRQYYTFRLLCAIANNAHPRTKAPLTNAQRAKLTLICADAVAAGVFRHDYGHNLTPHGVPRRVKRRATLLPVVERRVRSSNDDADAKRVAAPFDARAFRDENDARIQRMIDEYFVALQQRYPNFMKRKY